MYISLSVNVEEYSETENKNKNRKEHAGTRQAQIHLNNIKVD